MEQCLCSLKNFFLHVLLPSFLPVPMLVPAILTRVVRKLFNLQWMTILPFPTVIHWEIMPGKYVLNFRYYRASDSEGVVHRLTENQLINAIKYSIEQIDKNKLYAIQLNWSSSETSRRSIEKALKENTLLGGRYSAFDKKIQKITTKSFVQSPFIRKLCMQIDNLKMSCNFKSYFLEPILFKTGEYSSGKTIRSDENANIDWIGLASYELWFSVPINQREPQS